MNLPKIAMGAWVWNILILSLLCLIPVRILTGWIKNPAAVWR